MTDEPPDADRSLERDVSDAQPDHDVSDAQLDHDANAMELDRDVDDVVPSQGVTRIVGLGGSAGGIRAMQRFFEAMPVNSGMAFVIVLHLSPDHDSSLSEVIQTWTRMPVAQADSGQRLLPDHVYVIPPGKALSLADGHLRLTELPRERGRRMTVDLFFRSLADTHGSRAVAIVLSGVDGDGALGIKRVKERGGLTIAQDPDDAEQSGMPQSAIATSMVDWVLKAREIPERLVEYQKREGRLQLPPESGPNPATAPRPTPSDEETALRDVLAFLRTRTGRDFSYYKRATIVRRIARRMQVNGVDDLTSYLSYLRMHPGEAGALLQDLLISVTNFFRDRDAFDALKAQIPGLFQDKTATDTVRVWVPACATGEEAYSIAILLSEHARTLTAPPSLQIFATDLDEAVLAEARAGIYPDGIFADVSPERLQRFFVKDHHGYRVRRELREILLFAVHDLLKDSPFSRLDLISCRNLLIYLNRDAQKHALDVFHFALRREGRLFLGISESADDTSQLFQALDKKHRIYVCRATGRPRLPVPTGPSTSARSLALQNVANPGVTLARKDTRERDVASLTVPDLAGQDRLSWSELHLRLIERSAPPSLVVNANDDILHLSEGAARFLHFIGGEPSMNLLHVVHPTLRSGLRAALFRARETAQPSSAPRLPLELAERQRLVDIHVAPGLELAPDCSLVTFELRPESEQQDAPRQESDEPVLKHLERELVQTKRDLKDIIDQQEVSTEELKASNEELQAMNEELRSATEELETSREELQSINEELTTVNHELKNKVDELGNTNNHLHNLMSATAIAMIFLDRELRIVRYTPPAVDLFSLIQSDVGRPLAHLQHTLAYPELLTDAAQVLEDLTPIKREVADSTGRFFLARALPFRTSDDRIAGVVLTFVDVTELHDTQDALRRVQQDLEQRVRERTAQLDDANSALREEVLMHERAEKSRQELQRHLVGAQEQERTRISRELHDEVGQQITALMLALKALESGGSTDETPAKLRELRAIAEQIGREVHQLASQLRPVALDELGLSRALSGYLDTWAARSGIAVDFFSTGIEESRLPPVLETTLYRIVQEAMNNVFKHASAKAVSVSIERRDGHVLAFVEDDGSGFELDSLVNDPGPRLGIAGMRERASIVGGDLTLESSVGGGTTVRVSLPISA
ncbi:MAG TPA: chemotaxis protein CheB [Polyangiaceae bacterium]